MAAGPLVRRRFDNLAPLQSYSLDELIGCGTFSEVFRATHRETNEVLALKCFRQYMRTPTHYRLAAREIAFMRILNHPNIVSLKVYEISRPFVYIGTEFAVFGSLRTFLKSLKKTPAEPVVQKIMSQLLSALDYMHNLGVIHGDIKPHNMLCTGMRDNAPVVKLCDFGLSQIKLRGIDMVFKSGSFVFMAPEIHLRAPVDTACDIWSAGIMMYYIMFNRNPFNVNENEREKQINLMRRRTQPDYTGSERYSENCLNLLQGLLRYDKNHRLQKDTLRQHPFLNLEAPPKYGEKFLQDARFHAESSFANGQNKNHGEALVESMQAVLELQVQHNLEQDENVRCYLRKKWDQYENFSLNQEKALVYISEPLGPCPEECGDAEFRKHLMSTPKLLDGFDIGRSAEMFLSEGKKAKALAMFHEALQLLLPLMKNEPKSNRKEILGQRLKRWIQEVEVLTNETKSAKKNDNAVEEAAAGIANIPVKLTSKPK